MYSLLRRGAEYLVLNKGDKISTDFRLCKILMRIYSHMSYSQPDSSGQNLESDGV